MNAGLENRDEEVRLDNLVGRIALSSKAYAVDVATLVDELRKIRDDRRHLSVQLHVALAEVEHLRTEHRS